MCVEHSQENQFWLGTPCSFVPMRIRCNNRVVNNTESVYVGLHILINFPYLCKIMNIENKIKPFDSMDKK